MPWTAAGRTHSGLNPLFGPGMNHFTQLNPDSSQSLFERLFFSSSFFLNETSDQHAELKCADKPGCTEHVVPDNTPWKYLFLEPTHSEATGSFFSAMNYKSLSSEVMTSAQ